jgi:hypothetical protein
MLSLTLEHHDEPDEEIAETLCRVSSTLKVTTQVRLHHVPPAGPSCFKEHCRNGSHQYLMQASPGDSPRKLLDALASWKDRGIAPTLFPR